MIIQADKQGIDLIQQLCEIALRTGGMKNRDGVNMVMDSLKEIQPEVIKQDIQQESNKENVP